MSLKYAALKREAQLALFDASWGIEAEAEVETKI